MGFEGLGDLMRSRCLSQETPKPRRFSQEGAKFYSRSHNAVIRVYDEARNVIETHEHAGDFKEP
jgi:hypothetical protein